MTVGSKIMIAGCSAGAVSAVLPAAYATACNYIRRPITKEDFLSVSGSGFVTAGGKEVILKGVNINDEVFDCLNYGTPIPDGNGEAFRLIEKRFGNYGARDLFFKVIESRVSDDDIRYFKKTGINCIRIPLRNYVLLKNGNAEKEDIDFSRLDKLVAKCRKAGIYIIFDLHAAPGYQNNDKSCGKENDCKLFERSRRSFGYRNDTIKIWTKLAKHYKNEPAVAAYDLLNRPLNRVVDADEKKEMLFSLYNRTLKAIREMNDNHVVIMECAGMIERLPDAEKLKGKNVAFGIYSHYHTVYEAKSVIKSVLKLKENNMPVIACKVRLYENCSHIPDMLDSEGISWLGGDYKGKSTENYLYAMKSSPVELTGGDYASITEALTGNCECSKNEKLDNILKASCSAKPKRNKPKIYYACGDVYKLGR